MRSLFRGSFWGVSTGAFFIQVSICDAAQLKCKPTVSKFAPRLQLSQIPYKGLSADQKKRVIAAVKSTRLFDLKSPTFWGVSDQSQSGEAASLGVSISHIVMDILNKSEREELVRAIEDPKATDAGEVLPPSFLKRIHEASETTREDFCKELRSANRALARASIQKLVIDLYANMTESSQEYMNAVRDWDKFYGFSRPISDVMAFGRISIPKLLREKMHRDPETDTPVFLVRNVPEQNLNGILYAVVRNPSTQKLELRIDLAVESETVYKPTSHALAAQGAEVVYSGELIINELGQLEAVNLSSGHYMMGREDEMATVMYRTSVATGIPSLHLSRAAAEIDEQNLKTLMRRTFGLEFSPKAILGKHVFAKHADWLAAENKLGNEKGEIPPIIHRREFAREHRP